MSSIFRINASFNSPVQSQKESVYWVVHYNMIEAIKLFHRLQPSFCIKDISEQGTIERDYIMVDNPQVAVFNEKDFK